MAGTMRLVAGGTTKDFSPLLNPAYHRPDDRDRQFFQAADGGRYYYDYGGKEDHIISLNDVSKADADQFNTWWQNRTMLTFSPDHDAAPGTTIYVKILNEQRPFQMFFPTGWQDRYNGTMELHEVSSSSSSSSSSA